LFLSFFIRSVFDGDRTVYSSIKLEMKKLPLHAVISVST
jgi:hypothetical protein